MSTKKKSFYDERSYDLALAFLAGWEFLGNDADDLAKTIQGAIEEWFRDNPHVKEKR